MTNLNLKYAIAQLKQGQVLSSYLELQKFKVAMEQAHQKIPPELLENYQLALNILFDRNLTAAKETLQKGNEKDTFVLLLNILNIYQALQDPKALQDKDAQKKSMQFARFLEKWALRVLNTLKNADLRKKNTFKTIEPHISLFGAVSVGFSDVFIPTIERITKKAYNVGTFHTLEQTILGELCVLFLKMGDQQIKNRNLLEAKRILMICHHIERSLPTTSKISQRIFKYSLKTLELATVFEIEAGKYFRKNNDFERATHHFRLAYNQYKTLKQPGPQQKAKDEYLQTCLIAARNNLKSANRYSKKNDQDNAIFYFQKAIEKFENINAKKDLSRAQKALQTFYSLLGRDLSQSADRISPDTLQNIRQAQALYEEAKHLYEKAQNTKKLRETRSNIHTLQKQRYKLLQKTIQKYHQKKEYEMEFLGLEELHYLAYELKDSSKTHSYAKQLEKLKKKINFTTLERMREDAYMAPWLKQTPSKIQDRTNLIFQPISQSSQDLPDIFKSPNQITPPFFDTQSPNRSMRSGNMTDLTAQTTIGPNPTYFQNPTISQQPGAIFITPVSTGPTSVNLKPLYQIIKKFNSKKYLIPRDIAILQSVGVNLPQDATYYHRFPKSVHQFYVHITPSKVIQVLMIPTKNLINQSLALGSLAFRVDSFLPVDHIHFLVPEILEDHINFAMHHPQWLPFIEGFQFSTLDHYFYFLHAIRLYYQKSTFAEVAKYLNSSVIAEFINVPTDQLEKFLEKLEHVVIFEEIFNWANPPNFQLFFIGLYYFRRQQYKLAATIWSFLSVS